ncbi:hypothetical protein DXG03_004821 [Asterophora parasitica]|uniref:Yeast cell wall synthesis Kre9/Knh1-like N-terminal domain-containing protein n=1 Tax=Asterophora parasitica TaxID=117018 RepID=A0A9P7G667_9AGAR|nr:hypothetical protein DXG03_004821 [Asterophora parasitica]
MPYFIINEPTRNTQWTIGTANPVSWVKGVHDGITQFDVEMARLSEDGLTLIARNVPATHKSLNILLQNVPPGDDYFLIFINSTHGVTHATSQRFTVAAAGSTASGKIHAPPVPNAETVTISGPPNPTLGFATTFAALNNGVLARWGSPGQAWSIGGVFVSCVLGAAWTLR